MTYGVFVQCDICRDSYDLSLILFIPCGHGFCYQCTHKMQDNRLCAVCRRDKGKGQPHHVYVTVTGSSHVEPPKTVAEGIDRIDIDTPAVSVERATRKIRQELSRNLDDTTKSELPRALERLEERILPFYIDLEKTKSENKALQKDVSTLQQQLTQMDALQAERERLRQELAFEHERAETTLALTKEAREHLIREIEARNHLDLTVRRQHRTLSKKDLEIQGLRDALAESERKRHATQTKLKALSKPIKVSMRRPTQGPDDSLEVEPPILGELSPATGKKRRRAAGS